MEQQWRIVAPNEARRATSYVRNMSYSAFVGQETLVRWVDYVEHPPFQTIRAFCLLTRCCFVNHVEVYLGRQYEAKEPWRTSLRIQKRLQRCWSVGFYVRECLSLPACETEPSLYETWGNEAIESEKNVYGTCIRFPGGIHAFVKI